MFGCYRSPKQPVCLTRVATQPVGTAAPRDRASRPRVPSPRHTAHGCETHVPWSAEACALSRPVVRRSEHSRAELARLPTRPLRVAEADPNRDVMNTSHIPPTEARSDAAEERAHPAGPCAFPRRPCRQAGNETSRPENHHAPRRARSTSVTRQLSLFRRCKHHRISVALLHAPAGTAACSANRSSAELCVGPTGGEAQSPSVIYNVAVAAPQQGARLHLP